MIRWVSRLRTVLAQRDRTSGEPRSANGASSFHLMWEVPPVPLVEVSATCEVLLPPTVARLYFWALQVSFVSGSALSGGAHLGLQWNPRFPHSTAANWGGYDGDGNLLHGGASRLPSARRDPNTRDYPWKVGHRYRFRVAPSPESPPDVHAWRGSITDVESGETAQVRDLYTAGEFLASPMVWVEVFARCEQPSVAVRWSNFEVVTATGDRRRPPTVRVNYQTRADGGCDNTTAGADELGILQVTSAPRQVPQGAMLPVPGSAMGR